MSLRGGEDVHQRFLITQHLSVNISGKVGRRRLQCIDVPATGQRWCDNDNCLGWSVNAAVSPEAVLGGVLNGLPVDVGLLPFGFKWQHFAHKVDKEVGNLACRRQDPGQLGLVVTGEAEAARRDDGDAQAQADLFAVGREQQVTMAEDGCPGADRVQTG